MKNYDETVEEAMQQSFLEVQNRGCETCRFYSPLKNPREIENGSYIYGYCFVYGTKEYNLGMGKELAVYIPEGACKKHKRIGGTR